ncbi:MAG: hypothetical protein J2P36_09565 [Ktedonobacteraceae bacterium]|nr:hypothetical protein [Ktedonobacteraceae bacterium]
MTNFVLTLHAYNPYLVIVAAAVVGIWGLILFFMKKATSKIWYYGLYITAGLGALQALLGIILLVFGLKPGKPNDALYYLHYVYGTIVALGIPIGVTYATGGKNPRRDVLIFSLAAVVVAAAGVRALMTGPNN